MGSKNNVYVIAEAGSNHDGKYNQAIELINIAKEAGADAVKFQVFRADKLYHKDAGNIDFMGEKFDLYGFLKKMEMPFEWIPKLKEYCDKLNIDFLFSVFDIDTLSEIKKYNISAIKIASPELNFSQLFEECAKLNKRIIFSTGISKLSDIEAAVDIIERYHRNYVILHCITSYPASIEQCNLNVLQTLKSAFNSSVGLSDHTMDYENVPSLAVALGADVIEKHFTISRKMNGADHKFALEPDELKFMITNIRKIEKLNYDEKNVFINSITNSKVILGSSTKKVQMDEELLYKYDRRSIITKKEIEFGEKITFDNIDILRAERNIKPGIEPKYLSIIMGKKVNKNIKSGVGIEWDDLLND